MERKSEFCSYVVILCLMVYAASLACGIAHDVKHATRSIGDGFERTLSR